jgi:hypothetical protein
MLDLETLGTVPGCVGLSIGAVQFDPREGTLGREFYVVVSRADSVERFLTEDASTKEWWARQSHEAQQVLRDAESEDACETLPHAMSKLNNWFSGVGNKTAIRLYGNGADFDNPILRVMYQCANIQPYPAAFGGRCYRTLKNLDELFGPDFAFRKIERQGTYHNALDDAKSQAQHLMGELALIKAKLYNSH